MLFEALPQPPLPIHITVMQPPPSGLPEWLKILLTALTGAVFGFFAEPIKQTITKWRLRRDIEKHLSADLMSNLSHVENALEVLQGIEEKSPNYRNLAIKVIQMTTNNITDDRYRFYFDGQYKALVYDIDDKGDLKLFYTTAVSLKEANLSNLEAIRDFGILLRMTKGSGKQYISDKKLAFKAAPNTVSVSADGNSIEFSEN